MVGDLHGGAIYHFHGTTYCVGERYSGEGCSTERPKTLTGVWGVLFCGRIAYTPKNIANHLSPHEILREAPLHRTNRELDTPLLVRLLCAGFRAMGKLDCPKIGHELWHPEC